MSWVTLLFLILPLVQSAPVTEQPIEPEGEVIHDGSYDIEIKTLYDENSKKVLTEAILGEIERKLKDVSKPITYAIINDNSTIALVINNDDEETETDEDSSEYIGTVAREVRQHPFISRLKRSLGTGSSPNEEQSQVAEDSTLYVPIISVPNVQELLIDLGHNLHNP